MIHSGVTCDTNCSISSICLISCFKAEKTASHCNNSSMHSCLILMVSISHKNINIMQCKELLPVHGCNICTRRRRYPIEVAVLSIVPSRCFFDFLFTKFETISTCLAVLESFNLSWLLIWNYQSSNSLLVI